MIIKELQIYGYKKLANTVFQPELETDLLLVHVLRKERAFLYAHANAKLSKIQISNGTADCTLGKLLILCVVVFRNLGGAENCNVS